ncbi:transposase, partial [Xanthocytophaga agilis]
PSKEQVLWNQYNIFITNVPPILLSVGQVRSLYRLRWQIELLFKAWKSIFQIDQVKPMQLYRFQCLLWGALILVLMFMPLICFFKHHFWQEKQREVSEWKMLLWLKTHIRLLVFSIWRKTKSYLAFARKVYKQIVKDGLKEKRKNEKRFDSRLPFEILFTS